MEIAEKQKVVRLKVMTVPMNIGLSASGQIMDAQALFILVQVDRNALTGEK